MHKQHVDLFLAFHPNYYKPNARSYNVVQEDIDHYLKHGSFLHGEWFIERGRCEGGDHSSPLPEGLHDAEPSIAQDVALEGIIRTIVKLVERHGKGLYDALGNIPNQVLTATLTDSSNALEPGTRALVRYLAWHKPRTGTPKAKKMTTWKGLAAFSGAISTPRSSPNEAIGRATETW